MDNKIFRPEWNKRLCEAVNQDETYRKLASDWKWPLILRMYDKSGKNTDNSNRSIYVDFWKGKCRSISTCDKNSDDKASFVIAADKKQWTEL